MTRRTASRVEQIEALLHHRAGDLVMECFPGESVSAKSYRDLFTVTRKEVEEYAKAHYRLHDFAESSPGPADGFYVIPVPGGYHTYYQERRIVSDELVVHSDEEAWQLVVDYLLLSSGTGFRFE